MRLLTVLLLGASLTVASTPDTFSRTGLPPVPDALGGLPLHAQRMSPNYEQTP